MTMTQKVLGFLSIVFKTLRLAIMRVGAGWMFALLTFNFNRTAIADLKVIALIVATLIGLHHFISFFQVYWGHMADRHPIFGFRRTPYILLSSLVGSLIFLALPTIAAGMANPEQVAAWQAQGIQFSSAALALNQQPWLAMLLAFVLIFIFGVAMAANGSSSNALVAEVTNERDRGIVIAVVWLVIIVSGIFTAAVSRVVMPDFDIAKMQQLYNLTPIIVMVAAVIGVIGMERRISREEHQKLLAVQKTEGESPFDTLRLASKVMKSNAHIGRFFMFVLLGIMGIFLQDAVLEPLGAEVFGMIQEETARFQQVWGVGAILGMLLIGILSVIYRIPRKTVAIIGGLGIAAGLILIAVSAATYQRGLIDPALMLMGISIGLFDVGALAMMMEMTVDESVGFYMGLWGMAQGLGNGVANVLSGALHTGLIETGLMSVAGGYAFIFGFEALVMIAAVGVLSTISVREFKGISRSDIGQAMALETTG